MRVLQPKKLRLILAPQYTTDSDLNSGVASTFAPRNRQLKRTGNISSDINLNLQDRLAKMSNLDFDLGRGRLSYLETPGGQAKTISVTALCPEDSITLRVESVSAFLSSQINARIREQVRQRATGLKVKEDQYVTRKRLAFQIMLEHDIMNENVTYFSDETERSLVDAPEDEQFYGIHDSRDDDENYQDEDLSLSKKSRGKRNHILAANLQEGCHVMLVYERMGSGALHSEILFQASFLLGQMTWLIFQGRGSQRPYRLALLRAASPKSKSTSIILDETEELENESDRPDITWQKCADNFRLIKQHFIRDLERKGKFLDILTIYVNGATLLHICIPAEQIYVHLSVTNTSHKNGYQPATKLENSHRRPVAIIGCPSFPVGKTDVFATFVLPLQINKI
ncbi:unnamed protein product [Protopolystoma xenopodis]|uniref:Uncharacterized protein n=1 Tax=Protopolystoma xenopodis TaxID=117903 RepID=A0A3S5AGP4_9PLAT|nr:unnamed protein product [Protopolystoma xenopodis]